MRASISNGRSQVLSAKGAPGRLRLRVSFARAAQHLASQARCASWASPRLRLPVTRVMPHRSGPPGRARGPSALGCGWSACEVSLEFGMTKLIGCADLPQDLAIYMGVIQESHQPEW